MADSLRIIIDAVLKDPTLQSIKTQLDKIKKDYGNLSINVKIDDSIIKTLQGFTASMEKFQVASQEQKKTIEQFVDVTKKLDGSTVIVTKNINALGEVMTKIRTVQDETKKSVDSEAKSYENLGLKIKIADKALLDSISTNRNAQNIPTSVNVKSSQGYTSTTTRLEGDGETLRGTTVTENIKKEQEQYNRDFAKLLKDEEIIDKAHYQALRTIEEQALAYDKNHYAALKMNKELYVKDIARLLNEAEAMDRKHYLALKTDRERSEAQNKQHYQALQMNQKRENDIGDAKIALQTKIDNMKRKFGDSIDVKGLDDLGARVGQVNNKTVDWQRSVKSISQDLDKFSSGVKTSGSHMVNFSEAFSQAITKFPIWINKIVPYISDDIRITENMLETL